MLGNRGDKLITVLTFWGEREKVGTTETRDGQDTLALGVVRESFKRKMVMT